MKRTVFALALVAGGFVAGQLLSGRGPADEPAVVAAPLPAPAADLSQSTGAPSMPAAADLPDLTAVADRAVRAAANIASRQIVRQRVVDPFFEFFRPGRDPYGYSEQQSLGSGVIVSPDGYVLTNNHVVGSVRAEISVTLPDNREMPGRIVGVDPMTDLAVLKVDAANLTPLPWGDSDRLRMAEWVLAIGNPFALNHSVTLGIVSALDRTSPDLSAYTGFIQTDAAINPGNSGGALVNQHGELVGINSAIYSETGGYQGVGFAIPSNLARRVMAEIIEHGEVQWGSISGVLFRDLTPVLAQRVGFRGDAGAIVLQMYRDYPAYLAGLRPGDVVRSFNGQPVDNVTQLTRLMADAEIGSTARLEVVREGRTMTIEVPVTSASGGR